MSNNNYQMENMTRLKMKLEIWKLKFNNKQNSFNKLKTKNLWIHTLNKS